MQRLLDAAGWDAGSLRHKQIEDAMAGAGLALVDRAVEPAQCSKFSEAIALIRAEACPFKDGTEMADGWAEAWATFLNRLGSTDAANELYANSSELRTPAACESQTALADAINRNIEVTPELLEMGVNEICEAWGILESHGFPPEATGWPEKSLGGQLPGAIDSAIAAAVAAREDILAEVAQMNLLWIWICLTAGNLISAPDWAQAFERTYFQGVAILGVWFVSAVKRWLTHPPHVRGSDA